MRTERDRAKRQDGNPLVTAYIMASLIATAVAFQEICLRPPELALPLGWKAVLGLVALYSVLQTAWLIRPPGRRGP